MFFSVFVTIVKLQVFNYINNGALENSCRHCYL